MTQLSSGNPKRFSALDNTVKKRPLLSEGLRERAFIKNSCC